MGIVNSTNEALNEKNILSERIFKKAGPDIKKEIKNEIRGQFIHNTLYADGKFKINTSVAKFSNKMTFL